MAIDEQAPEECDAPRVCEVADSRCKPSCPYCSQELKQDGNCYLCHRCECLWPVSFFYELEPQP